MALFSSARAPPWDCKQTVERAASVFEFKKKKTLQHQEVASCYVSVQTRGSAVTPKEYQDSADTVKGSHRQ